MHGEALGNHCVDVSWMLIDATWGTRSDPFRVRSVLNASDTLGWESSIKVEGRLRDAGCGDGSGSAD